MTRLNPLKSGDEERVRKWLRTRIARFRAVGNVGSIYVLLTQCDVYAQMDINGRRKIDRLLDQTVDKKSGWRDNKLPTRHYSSVAPGVLHVTYPEEDGA